jgi:glycosyltransferase involved in cell wall biosynthesis
MTQRQKLMIKIAQFVDSLDPGGAETLAVDLSQRIRQYGFHAEVFHFGNAWIESQCNNLGITCLRVPAFRYYRSVWTLPFFAISFARFLRARRINILHSHLLGSIIGGSLASVLSHTRHVGTLHDTYTIEAKPTQFLTLPLAALLGTRLVVVSEHMRQYFRGLSKVGYPVFQKIPNGVNIEQFHRPRNTNLRKRLALNQDDVVFISVGRLVEIKRHDVLIHAFGLLGQCLRQRPIPKLLIVGDGPTRQRLEGLIAEQELKDSVKILGFRSDVADLLSVSDGFVLSSDSEGLSYSIVEAMAAGLPAVVTDVGGNNELIEHGHSGYIAPRNDPRAFAHYLQKIARDEAMRKRFGENAHQRACEWFSIGRTIQQYVDLYTEILL